MWFACHCNFSQAKLVHGCRVPAFWTEGGADLPIQAGSIYSMFMDKVNWLNLETHMFERRFWKQECQQYPTVTWHHLTRTWPPRRLVQGALLALLLAILTWNSPTTRTAAINGCLTWLGDVLSCLTHVFGCKVGLLTYHNSWYTQT